METSVRARRQLKASYIVMSILRVGMYDFQIIDDVNPALHALNNVQGRNRPWRA
jgi:hypothetical protein